MRMTIVPGNRGGEVSVPPSKSDAQRAILAATFCQGKSKIQNIGKSSDVQNMLKAIHDLGAHVQLFGDHVEVLGSPLVKIRKNTINVGESGLAFRLVSAVIARYDNEVILSGKGTLLARKMDFLTQYFPLMGVQVQLNDDNCPPVVIKGPLRAGMYRLDAKESSQYISGLLMVLPLLQESTELIVKNIVSAPYIEMTIKTLKLYGVTIDYDGKEHFKIHGKQVYRSSDYVVEGDWSAASYWLTASALGAPIAVKGVNNESLQADRALISILMDSGCTLVNMDEGIQTDGRLRMPLKADATHCPDLFPALVTYAALTPGVSLLTGVERLAGKESNRGEVLKQEFAKLGIRIEITGNEMLVFGVARLQGGVTVDAHGDHRIAMCLAIAGMFCQHPIQLTGAEAVSKSYPEFWLHFEQLEALEC